MPTSTKSCKDETEIARPGLPAAYYPLHSLLHTLRTLQSHEDQICSLLADIQRTGKVGAGTRKELTAMLHTLPAASFEQELHAVFSALEQ